MEKELNNSGIMIKFNHNVSANLLLCTNGTQVCWILGVLILFHSHYRTIIFICHTNVTGCLNKMGFSHS
jgi:hypothetical protein